MLEEKGGELLWNDERSLGMVSAVILYATY